MLARLSLEGDIHFINRACAEHQDVQGKKRGGKNGETREKKRKNLTRVGSFCEAAEPVFYHPTFKFACP